MKLKLTGYFLFLIIMLTQTIQAQKHVYEVSMENPYTHYFDVTLTYTGEIPKKGFLDFKMATWAPGSYLIREFSKSVEAVSATNETNKSLEVNKLSKNTWRVNTKKSKQVKFNYRVYAFEHSVRTSYLDASHGYINGTSVFVYIDGMQDLPSIIKINPFDDWKVISTPLKATSDIWTREAANFDELVDSPIEIGNHEVWEFKASGIPHKIAMYGDNNADKTKVLNDLKLIVEQGAKLFGDHPCKEYIFFIHNMSYGGGGLEHSNSTSLIVNRFSYSSNRGYKNFLGLVSHEYFHLWNVKRLRPKALGPFDYENENYTSMLWVVEGFTSYFDDIILQRAGLMATEKYLLQLESSINNIESQPGNKVQSVSEASLDAWVKAYRPNENSRNTTISYYSKGSVIGAMLDLEIINNTNGKKSLDDVMRFLYEEYYKKKKRGYSNKEFKDALENIAGKKMDSFFNNYIKDTKTIDYSTYVGYAGLKIDSYVATEVKLGAKTKNENGKLVITNVTSGSSAFKSGLNVKDEIIAINGYRADDGYLQASIVDKKVGDNLDFMISRDEQLMTIKVTLLMSEKLLYTLDAIDKPSKKQKTVYRKWLMKGQE